MRKRPIRIFSISLLFMLPLVATGARAENSGPTTAATAAGVSADPCGGAADAATDAAGQGNCQAKNAIKNATEAMTKLNINNAPALTAAYQKYDKAWKSCVDKQKNAANACLESLSPELSSALSAIGGIVAAISGASATNSCSDFGKAMDLANKGLTGYSAACGTMKGQCASACKEALSALDQIKNTANAAVCARDTDEACSQQLSAARSSLNAPLQQEKSSSDKTSMAGKQATCGEKYSQLMGNAAAGIASMLGNMMQGNKCQQETTAAAATTVDCTDPSQSQTPTCLCKANPRLVGCDNSLQKANESGDGQRGIAGVGGGMNNSTAGTPDLNLPPTAPDMVAAHQDSSSAVGGAAGAGSSLGGGGSLSAAGAGSPEGGAPGKGLDANVLAGYEGGGGGGGSWGSGGSEDAAEKYRKYLPGGSRDPRKLAGRGEITSQGSKSNWEKIRERYVETRPSLINNY